MSIRRGIERLEAAGEGRGCGPDCPPGLFLLYRQDGPDGEPVVIRQDGSDAPCPRCGRPAEVGELVEIVVRTREEVQRVLAGGARTTAVEQPGAAGGTRQTPAKGKTG